MTSSGTFSKSHELRNAQDATRESKCGKMH